MGEQLVKKLAEVYPNEIELALREVLIVIAENLSPSHLHLQVEEYIHLLNEKNWNYKQVSCLLNNFFNLSFKFFEANGIDKFQYSNLVKEAQRHISLWNRDIKPIKDSYERQKQFQSAIVPIAKA